MILRDCERKSINHHSQNSVQILTDNMYVEKF